MSPQFMKSKLLTILALLTLGGFASAHEGVEIGPNGGRILEFSKDETMHGEVTLKDGAFFIGLLDKDMKPVPLSQQSLSAVTGDRSRPQKLEVTKGATGFIVPVVKAGDWLILQYKDSPGAKSITARMEYNTNVCDECKAQEWLCACKPEERPKN
jgi:hypothetical protein